MVKAPTDIPRIMEIPRCWPTRSQRRVRYLTLSPITAGICNERNGAARHDREARMCLMGPFEPAYLLPHAAITGLMSAENIRQGLSRGQFRVLVCRVPF